MVAHVLPCPMLLFALSLWHLALCRKLITSDQSLAHLTPFHPSQNPVRQQVFQQLDLGSKSPQDPSPEPRVPYHRSPSTCPELLYMRSFICTAPRSCPKPPSRTSQH